MEFGVAGNNVVHSAPKLEQILCSIPIHLFKHVIL